MRGSVWKLHLLATLAAGAGCAGWSQQFAISTVAGGALPLGNAPVAALTVPIGFTRGIVTDQAGNVIFANIWSLPGRNRESIFKLDKAGILTAVVNGPQEGYSGDGGPAASAQINGVSALAIDGSGNLYIADTINRLVRKVSADGIVITVATFPFNFGPLAVDTAGNLFVAGNSSPIRRISVDGTITSVAGNGTYGYSGDGGAASSAQIGEVSGLAVDGAGDLYFSDSFTLDDDSLPQCRVRRVSPDGTVTTVAGSGNFGYSGDGGPATQAQLSSPSSLTIDSAGNLYIADGPNVRKVSADGNITTVAGNGTSGYSGDSGPSIFAQLGSVAGLAADTAGNLYIADGPRIRRVSAAGIIDTVAGNGASLPALGDGGPATEALLLTPVGVAVDSTEGLYIADAFDDRVRKISANGAIVTVAGKGGAGLPVDGVPASSAYLFWPAGMATDRSGNLYIAASGDGRVRMISPAGIITTVAGSGVEGRPGYSGDGGPATDAVLSWPKDVALDDSGNMYVADTGNNRIRMISAAGIITTAAGNGIAGYAGDGGSATGATLNVPSGLAVDKAGNVYIADTNNFRVRKVSANGIITTIAGNGVRGYAGDGGLAVNAQLTSPLGLKFDSAGNLYIADGASVRKLSSDGVITTVAGNGVQGYSGDGGPATAAQLGAWALAFDGAGNLYVSDPWNSVVRLLRLASGQGQ